MKPNFRPFGAVLGAAVLAVVPLAAQAQPFPNRPITIVVPYPPGASTDFVARLVSPKVSAALGQPVIVESKPGANGSVGAAYIAKSAPDGYRILLGTQPIVAISPYTQGDMGFDPLRELTPLTKAVNAPVALAVHSSLGVNSLAEFIAYAKKNPGSLTYGTAGAGSPQHVGGILLSQRAGIDTTHVPYKGGGPMMNDLLAGHIKAGIATLVVFKPHVAGQKIRVIAIGEPKRFPGMQDVPTMSETLPGFELTTWLAFFGPAGLPANLVATLSGELVKALRAEDVSAKLREGGLVVAADGPEALAEVARSDHELYGRIIRDHRISAQ